MGICLLIWALIVPCALCAQDAERHVTLSLQLGMHTLGGGYASESVRSPGWGFSTVVQAPFGIVHALGLAESTIAQSRVQDNRLLLSRFMVGGGLSGRYDGFLPYAQILGGINVMEFAGTVVPSQEKATMAPVISGRTGGQFLLSDRFALDVSANYEYVFGDTPLSIVAANIGLAYFLP